VHHRSRDIPGPPTDAPHTRREERLHVVTEQRPFTSKETVPVERVRLGTETVTEDQRVEGTVRKEQIDQVEVEGAAGERGLRGENRN
jgi:stress response protein YsnF